MPFFYLKKIKNNKVELIRKSVAGSSEYEVFCNDLEVCFRKSKPDEKTFKGCRVNIEQFNELFHVNFKILTFVGGINNVQELDFISLVSEVVKFWNDQSDKLKRLAMVCVQQLYGYILPLEYECPTSHDRFYLFVDEFEYNAVAFTLNLSGEEYSFAFNCEFLGEFLGTTDVVRCDVFEVLNNDLLFKHIYNFYFMNIFEAEHKLSVKVTAYTRKRKIAKMLS